MTLQEIKKAVNSGHVVCQGQDNYIVVKSKYTNEYFIKCTTNGYIIGLTWKDGKTMNGKGSDFYIKRQAA